MKSWPKVKLGKVIICSNLVLSTLIWPQNTYFFSYLALLTYIYHYLPIWLYLGLIILFGYICPDFTMCAIF